MEPFSYTPGATIAFHIWLIPITWYGILVVSGFTLATAFAWVEWTKKDKGQWEFTTILLTGIIVAIWGARLWYIIFNPVEVFQNVSGFLDVLLVFFNVGTGRSIMGSIFFITLWLYCYEKFISPTTSWKESIDIILPAMLLSQAIGRWGNFANHQVFGESVSLESLSFLPDFIKKNMYINGNYRQPLFLYESFADLIAYSIIFISKKTWITSKEGVFGAMFIMLYGIIRATMEPFRDATYQMHWGLILTSFWAAIIFSIIGTTFIIEFQWKWFSKFWV